MSSSLSSSSSTSLSSLSSSMTDALEEDLEKNRRAVLTGSFTIVDLIKNHDQLKSEILAHGFSIDDAIIFKGTVKKEEHLLCLLVRDKAITRLLSRQGNLTRKMRNLLGVGGKKKVRLPPF